MSYADRLKRDPEFAAQEAPKLAAAEQKRRDEQEARDAEEAAKRVVVDLNGTWSTNCQCGSVLKPVLVKVTQKGNKVTARVTKESRCDAKHSTIWEAVLPQDAVTVGDLPFEFTITTYPTKTTPQDDTATLTEADTVSINGYFDMVRGDQRKRFAAEVARDRERDEDETDASSSSRSFRYYYDDGSAARQRQRMEQQNELRRQQEFNERRNNYYSACPTCTNPPTH